MRKITQQAARMSVPGIRELSDTNLSNLIDQTLYARRGTYEWYLHEFHRREMSRRGRIWAARIDEVEQEKFVRVYDWELKSDRLTIQTTGNRDLAERMVKALEAGNLGPFTLRKVGA